MVATPQGPEHSDASTVGTRRATLVSLAFIVDAANISRAGGDLLEPLVFAAIVQANLAGLRHDPELQRLYGASGEALPDAARRPISVHAVAQSLRLPYETVRRRVRRLIDQGRCVAAPAPPPAHAGVYVPRAAITSARHAAVQAARMERLMRLHDDLVRTGFLSPAEALPFPLPGALVRTVNTALSQYMLRTCDRMVELVGDVMDGFVLLGLVVANTERLIAAAGSLAPSGLAAEPRPCSGMALAGRLGMAGETVRRRLPALGEAGYARRVTGGWIATAPAAERARIARLAADNKADLQRLFARLRELAVAAGPRAPDP